MNKFSNLIKSVFLSFTIVFIACSSSESYKISYDVIADPVDLGLSVKWASHNLGASAPHEFGGYYAYSETETKNDYTPETYMFNKTPIVSSSISGTIGDVAKCHWGNGWRLPSKKISETAKYLAIIFEIFY